MSQHTAECYWSLGERAFDYASYSRDHIWRFENGDEVKASAAPKFLGNASRIDPEEAYVASLSSCHMLTFLAICAHKQIRVLEYSDQAVGYLEKDSTGKLVITRVDLHPKVVFGEDITVSEQDLESLHEQSHHDCFLANSVKTEIVTHLN